MAQNGETWKASREWSFLASNDPDFSPTGVYVVRVCVSESERETLGEREPSCTVMALLFLCFLKFVHVSDGRQEPYSVALRRRRS